VVPVLLDACIESGGADTVLADPLFEGEGVRRWSTTCEVRLSGGWVRVVVLYSLRTPFGPLTQRREQAFALWNDGDGTRDARETANVWDLDNLERGRAIRIRFGGNLPMGYPTVASFRNGTATAIHSMDLSIYGWQDEAGAREEVSDWLEELAVFDGTPAPWGADGIDIPPGSVRTRRLILVVPANTDEDRFDALLADAARVAAGSGIDLSVVRYQERRPPVAVE
jgi:hypothetical protein